MAHFTRTLAILTDDAPLPAPVPPAGGYWGHGERDPLAPDADPFVDDDGILIIADDGPFDGDPLDLDPPLCPECGNLLWRYDGELFCADCTRVSLNGPRPAA